MSDVPHTFVMAEIGVNHNGSIEFALELIDLAAECGVDAVKFQTYQTERLARKETPKVPYQLRSGSKDETHFEMLKKLELPREVYSDLLRRCKDREVVFCSTPYSADDAAFLLEQGVSTIKVASADIIDRKMHEVLAESSSQLILSTGMATLEEIDETLELYRGKPSHEAITLLQCTSAYPCDPKDVNLKVMRTLQERFSLPVGFSDHTEHHFVALAAVALGATVIEKHFTKDKELEGPDHAASVTPQELALLVKGVREVEDAMGNADKVVQESEKDMRSVSRKSIVAARDMDGGTKLTEQDLDYLRPGTGVSPMRYPQFIGRILKDSVRKGGFILEEQLTEEG